MRIRTAFLLALPLVGLPSLVSAQQRSSTESNKTQHRLDLKFPPVPSTENWGVLEDIKTGLQPTAAATIQRDELPDFIRELVRVQWRIGDPIDLWVMRPKATSKAPVVLYLYNYTDSGERFHDDAWGKRATADGFAAVGFVSALSDYRFKNRPMKQWFVSELKESLGSSVHDVQLILDYLATRGDVDTDSVGMFGMGSGATIAILAAHADSRIKTLDLLDPWGDWPDWLEFSPVVPDRERPVYLSQEFLKSVAALDPVAYLPSSKRLSIRIQQTLSEPATPKIAKDRIASAIPDSGQVVKYASPRDLYKAWQTTGLSGWIKKQMNGHKDIESPEASK